MNVLDQLMSDAQPGYEPSVQAILVRLMQVFGDAAFDGVDRDGFGLHVATLLDIAELESGLRLQLLSDMISLGWWCSFNLSDEATALLAATARRTCYLEAQAIRFQLKTPDPAARTAHAVFVGGLVGPLHSPTRGAFDYAAALAADPDNRRIDVFHSGQMTPLLQAFAAERLGAHLARVHFFRIDDDPEFLAKAAGRGACTYHFWCEQAQAFHISLLALLGPTVMFTCGDEAPVQFADVYWYCHEADYIERLWARKGAPPAFFGNYRQIESVAFNRTPAQQARRRADFGWREDELIVVTAGNRLGVDMDQPFVDGMAQLVLANPRVRWVMVGKLQDFWLSAFEQVLGPQFSHVPFDTDLGGLFAVCDVFANPFRAGGGNTALMAIDAGAAVLTRADKGDVGAFVPSHHRAADTEVYFRDLQALVDDPAFRAGRLAEQQALLARRFDQQLFAREIKALSALAYERFVARTPVSLETIYAQPELISRPGPLARSM